MKIRFKTLFINYVDGLALDERLKKFITDEVFINDNPEFYLYYPALFSPLWCSSATSTHLI